MLGAATLAGLPSDVPRNRVADKGRDEVRLSGRNPPGDESAHEGYSEGVFEDVE